MADQLPRWDNEICTSIAGMPARQGQFRATALRNAPRRLGCGPAAPAVRPTSPYSSPPIPIRLRAPATFERDRSRFAYRQADNVSTMGQGALDEFLDMPRAVRWWHISETFGQNGISPAMHRKAA